jgi:triosephosphate isomerase (TIM)
MRSKLIIANWKLNGNWSFNEQFAGALSVGLKDFESSRCQIVICPPSIFLQQLGGLINEQIIYLGGQDLSDEISGPYTGEVSGIMLKEFGCRFVIVGHSERRSRHYETNEIIVKKSLNAIAAGLKPIICVGESLEQRQQGLTELVLKQQLDALLKGLSSVMDQVVLAYEPIWAIGTGQSADTSQAEEVHLWIRDQISQFDPVIAENTQIIYGGSVKSENARELMQMPNIDGLLVGGASLDAEQFLAICQAV